MEKKITSGRLRKFIELNMISPEALTEQLPFSNMSIRRWLKKEDAFVIPEKYQIHLSKHFNSIQGTSTEKNPIIKGHQLGIDPKDGDLEMQLNRLGSQQDENLFKELKIKQKKFKISTSFLQQLKDLAKYAVKAENKKVQLLALGALAYFINPFDFVPDHLPGVGLVDDIGIVSIAIERIMHLVSVFKK